MQRCLAVLFLVVCAGCEPYKAPPVVATTTSVVNSGLLEPWLREYGPVRVVPVGSGIALDLLARGDADVAITHAPEREAVALRAHPSWWYRKILYNDFVLVGPPDDPANVRAAADGVDAMRRIAASGAQFISRGDSSGTHERELQLWRLAGASPGDGRVVVAGASMAQTLRIAASRDAYTLTDRATFDVLKTGSVVVSTGDPRLLNTYAVAANPGNNAGIRLARWLAGSAGREAVTRLLRRGQVSGFTLWPAGGANDRPDAGLARR
jgi:tungstate transport system substrate-binding protein